MDREILFRGKRLNNGEWVCGSLIQMDSEGSQSFIFPFYKYASSLTCAQIVSMFMVAVDPATVGPFTGLTDKSGKKIFEGDKLTTDLFRPYVVVIFRDGCFMFNCNDGGKDYWDIMLPIMKEAQTQTLYHEVIGNIHDTPDLGLKEEAE